ncbi:MULTISPECIES: hypothetical protein [Lelliottia]|uniref:Uncharacterized protein n=1 Tax=Lelliottia wanjuensis TaxID=3050585 RepID=A0AAP4FW42_9ENTR|nr:MULTISPECIES: hypothetical protein [unclassified Lelliottia]MDK9357372.1 hypothetical protein [Lelliottia sp. V106_16]MDK9362257.1 hypothetical protein [Lelliottia sp. V106_12]MDK9373136.1 hypothetical protein [Lelliottia sp. V106_10]MDK9586556.1 hypothetical protein [Lelliottia sp. V86_10]MDK9599940.1 hypothetical protein [Lelliottia sp. V106_5]
MTRLLNDYIGVFTQRSEHIKNAVNRCVEYWAPEQVPLILLLSTVGKALIKQLDVLSENEKTVLFQHIEDGMRSDEDELATAVATGLVESLVTASDGNDELWRAIERYLGRESNKHAVAWKNFGQ